MSHCGPTCNGQSHRHLHTRKFANVAVTFVLPVQAPTSNAVIAGLLDTEGNTQREAAGERKPKDVSIGRIVRLRLSVVHYPCFDMLNMRQASDDG